MKIVSIGGGPGGLYFAILMKKAFPDVEIVVHERNRADDTFGWGVVFSDETLSGFEEADPESYREITDYTLNVRVSYAAAISDARLLAARGGVESIDRAIADLNRVADEAATARFVEDALEARLAAAEIAHSAGRPGAGDRLGQLSREASERGYKLISLRAGG